MKKSFIFILFSLFGNGLFAQYQFTEVNRIACTPIKSQDRTGTCWSYSTISFLESELMRLGQSEIDLSEMYIVRNIYLDKARNYVLRQGKANFSQGSLAHDVIRAYHMAGVVPESIFSGKLNPDDVHNHGDMEAAMKGMLDGITKQKQPNPRWMNGINALMDVYMGKTPEKFNYKGKEYTAESFANSLKINPKDYLSFTSYTHHPFYEECIIEIPDNYSNGSYFNIPVDELQAIVDNALANGYTVSWDGDVSEKGFSSRDGLAILPQDAKRKNKFTKPGKEISVNQALRQSTFMNYSTTDDHLMHIVGTAKDQNGTKYYIIKNSWGEISDYKGYLYMSEAYLRLKTVGILVNKNSVPKNVMNKLEM